MANKSLFIDGQVFQSAAWDRGMGKYSISLLKYLTSNKSSEYKDLFIIFTKNLSLPKEAEKQIKQASANAKFIYADLKVPDDPSQFDVSKMRDDNRSTIDEVITKFSPADNQVNFLILSLFIDQVCSTFPSQGKKILLFYDLIPLQFTERYSSLSSYPNYLARFTTILEADIILTISQTVADDVALYLGVDESNIYNIDGAPIERLGLTSVKPKFQVPKNYVLMPSGDDLRKNNLRAVQGFETYRRISNDSDIYLLITSTFTEDTKRTLNIYSDHLIFTENVSEAELYWLYKNSNTLLFVSEYEGLGLPILEAAEVDKPIVCSNLSVFNEISSTAFYYADQLDSYSISSALAEAINKKDLKSKLKEYPKILQRYTWDNTARKTLQAIDNHVEAIHISNKKKIAVFTPKPSTYSAIGKLVMQLHPAMSKYFDIDYYIESGKSNQPFKRPDYLEYISNVYNAEDFDKNTYRKYDAVLYNIGNSEFHLETIKDALYLPGYAIIHDILMTDVFEGPLKGYNYISSERLKAEALLDKKMNNKKSRYISSIVNNQIGLITHSKYTQEVIKDLLLEKDSTPIIRANLPTSTPKQTIRRLNESSLTIGLAGIIHPAKGLSIIEAIAESEKFFGCKIHIFGLSLVTEEDIQKLKAYPNVTVDTNITDFEFQSMLSQLDILVNFRTQYKGETSLATIEAMRFGVIPIVKKVGWYEELPDSAVLKVSNKDELILGLDKLLKDKSKVKQMKTAAKELIEKDFSYENYAQQLYKLLNEEVNKSKTVEISHAIKNNSSLTNIKKLIQD
jgi:glycosyltransferase involved in cell wall biosynthesis